MQVMASAGSPLPLPPPNTSTRRKRSRHGGSSDERGFSHEIEKRLSGKSIREPMVLHDSLLEGDGFELPVREHRAMAPSHEFAAASHGEAVLRGAPASQARPRSEAQRGSVRRAAAMRSTYREMRLRRHAGRPLSGHEPPPPHLRQRQNPCCSPRPAQR